MRKRKITALMGAGFAALLVLTGCAEGAPGAHEPLEFEVASDVALEGSPTYDAASQSGTIRVGVKEDQPGLGYLDATTGERSGFDVDIARWIAASLGFSEDQIEFQAIPSANREQALVNGDIDYYVGTYSITDERKTQIDFAGPYYVTGQGLLVRADSDIASEADLGADTNVCSATGSTPIQNIRDNYPEVPVTEFDTYSQCVEALTNNQVDVVTTDEAILLGYAAEQPEDLKVVGEPFTEENYGIGLPLGDDALRTFINDTLENGGETWQEIYDHNLGATGVAGEQPQVDRY
ncbi:ABC transporter substrate-binding protein [Pseudoclavibacter endophyticus]|uniref:Glutamate ABC transporter substrate-binding protein n=1 Tax=Pseudoclavibacter endophyticus TaxID=1778590 RepID=A0A6H9WB10_9MICO|nr:glutamate ABC transporter substrate-binding protein [Pseudoclavibacter endophyticus]KAB1646944.1 glutamate ABC transporter substrate-binding protein [Pseudoclavibacter endophyticus]GGA74199.1 ABC transporter substrate-binding protein [Pseudoclavibacter endophyticus]